MPSNKVSKKQKRSTKRVNKQPNRLPLTRVPPRYNQQIVRKWTVRCIATTAAVGNQFTVTQIASLMGVFSATTTTSFFPCNQFRLDRLRAWAWTATAGTPASLSAKWIDNPLATTVGISDIPHPVEDVSASTDIPAFIDLKPPRNSFADNWLAVTATPNLLFLTLPANAILDFFFSFLIDDIGTLSSGPALVAASAGTWYHKIITGSAGTVLTAVAPLNSI